MEIQILPLVLFFIIGLFGGLSLFHSLSGFVFFLVPTLLAFQSGVTITASGLSVIHILPVLILGIFASYVVTQGIKYQKTHSKSSPEYMLYSWKKCFEANSLDSLLSLYEVDSVLIPTFSSQIRVNHQEKKEYFENLFKLKKLSVKILEANLRETNDFAICSGKYVFEHTADGKRITLPALFTFTYKEVDNHWKIIHHHSSRLPE